MWDKIIYIVHGTNDPVDGDNVVFTTKHDALAYAFQFEGATVDMVEVDEKGDLVDRIPIHGPEVDAAVAASDDLHNSCVDCDVPGEMSAVFNTDDLEEAKRPSNKAAALSKSEVNQVFNKWDMAEGLDEEELEESQCSEVPVVNHDDNPEEKKLQDKTCSDIRDQKYYQALADIICEDEDREDRKTYRRSGITEAATDPADSKNIYLVIGCYGGELGFVMAENEDQAYAIAEEQWPDDVKCGSYLDKEFMCVYEANEFEVEDAGCDLTELARDGYVCLEA